MAEVGVVLVRRLGLYIRVVIRLRLVGKVNLLDVHTAVGRRLAIVSHGVHVLLSIILQTAHGRGRKDLQVALLGDDDHLLLGLQDRGYCEQHRQECCQRKGK